MIELIIVIELIMLIIVLFMSDRISHPLGAIFYFLISMTVLIPKIGWLFRFLFTGIPSLNALLKPMSWLISSSGLLIGLGIHALIWGTPDRPEEFWVILIIAMISVLGITNDIITFDLKHHYFDTVYKNMRSTPLASLADQHMTPILANADRYSHQALARQVFVDMTLPQFFRLLVGIGTIYYSLGHLGILQFEGSVPPDLWKSLIVSFSIGTFFSEGSLGFSGLLWNIVQLISAFLAFFWLVIFIGQASSSVDQTVDEVRENVQEDMLRRLRATLAEVTQSSGKQGPTESQGEQAKRTATSSEPSGAG